MIGKIFLTFLEISVAISIVAVLLMLITPRIDKKYNSKWRYYLLIFITARLLIPLNPTILNIKESLDISPNSIFSFESQPLTQLNIDISNMEVEEAPFLEKEKQYNSVDGRIMGLSEISMFQLVISLWIFGIIIHIIHTIIGYIIYRKKIIRWSSPILDGELSEMVREISEDMGINKDIIPMEYRGEISPQIMGLLRNMMILPNNKLQEDELEFIIRHELTHLKSHHLWIKLLSTLTKTIHWFNPFVYYIADELEVEMEIKCDYEVTKKFNSERRRYYADMLIKLMEMEIVKCDGLTTYFGGGKRKMKKRLVNIVGKRKGKRGIVPLITISLVTILICGTIVFAKEDVKTLTKKETRVPNYKMIENYNGVDTVKEVDVFKVIKGEIVEDSLIEKERERIAKICMKGKGGSGRRVFVITGELTDYNKDLFEVVNIKGTEKPKKIMNEEYSTTWDDIGNMIYSDYIFPKGKFTAEANGPFNICVYHEDGSIDIVSAIKSNDKYEVDIEVGNSYYVSIHNRRERYKDLYNTKYSFIPE